MNVEFVSFYMNLHDHTYTYIFLFSCVLIGSYFQSEENYVKFSHLSKKTSQSALQNV